MEEKNLNDELDVKEDELSEDELSEDELSEDEIDELEEYDFGNDEDVDDDVFDDDEDLEGGEDDAEADEDAEDEEQVPREEPAEENSEASVETTDKTASELQRATAVMEKMLRKLGYNGTVEEMMAAYEADENRAKETEAQPTEEPEKPVDGAEAPVDYRAMAERALRDINAAFGTGYTDFSMLDDPVRFATLQMNGATALEAFRATQKSFAAVGSGTEPQVEAVALKPPSRDHLKTLPRGGAAGGRENGPTKAEIASLKEMYPEKSAKEIAQLLSRVKRSH